MSCIHLIFCTNQSATSNHGVDVSIFNKCHHNITYGKINVRVPLRPIYFQEVLYYRNQILKILRKQYLILIGTKLLKSL